MARKINLEIANTLKLEIFKGIFPVGSRLPKRVELKKRFGVSNQTLQAAMNRLMLDGLVESQGMAGTVVLPSGKALAAAAAKAVKDSSLSTNGNVAGILPENGKKFVVLALREEGHIYEDMYRALVQQLQRQGIIPVPVHVDITYAMVTEELANAMSLKPLAVVMDGKTGDKLMDYLESEAENFGTAVFLMHKNWRPASAFRSHSVLTDYWYGAYSATKYLIGLGHRRIMLIERQWRGSQEDYRKSVEYEFEQGYRMALKEAGLEDYEHLFMEGHDASVFYNEFARALDSPTRPTAILACQDYRITSKLKFLRAAGIKVPEDMSLIGYYNTPWCEGTELDLTSVSIREDLIAAKAAEIIAGTDKASEIIIKPKLVLRKSCVSPGG